MPCLSPAVAAAAGAAGRAAPMSAETIGMIVSDTTKDARSENDTVSA